MRNLERWGGTLPSPVIPSVAAGRAWLQGDFKQVKAILSKNTGLARHAEDRRSLALYLGMLAVVELALENREEAATLSEEGLELAQILGDKWCLGLLLYTGELTRNGVGEPENSAPSLEILQAIDRNRQRAVELYRLGTHAYTLGEFGQARAFYEESLGCYRNAGDLWGQACLLGHLGHIARSEGRHIGAATLTRSSIKLARQVRTRPQPANLYWYTGFLALQQGRYNLATEPLEQSLAANREVGDKAAIALSLAALGNLAEGELARNYYKEALALAWRLKDKNGVAYLVLKLARVALQMGTLERANRLAEKGLSMYWKMNYLPGQVRGLETLAEILVLQGQAELAALLLGRAEAIRETNELALTGLDKEEWFRLVTVVRSGLSDRDFKEKWHRGRTMTLAQALELAFPRLDSKLFPGRGRKGPPFSNSEPQPERRKGQKEPTKTRLTRREAEVLRLVAQGLTDAGIGQELGLSAYTVGSYLRSVYQKLEVTSRTAAVHKAQSLNLL